MARERHVGVTVQRGCDYKIRVGRDGGHHRERYFMSVVIFVFSVQKYKNTKIQKKNTDTKKIPANHKTAGQPGFRLMAVVTTAVTGGDGW